MLYNFHTVVLFICIFNVSLLCLIYIVIFMYKALCTPWKRRYTNVIMYVCMYHGAIEMLDLSMDLQHMDTHLTG